MLLRKIKVEKIGSPYLEFAQGVLYLEESLRSPVAMGYY